LLFALIASKGGSGVTGTGFVTLAAILASVPSIPVQGLALLVGIEKLMSECRALTNVVGNGVATLVVSRWQHELDPAALRSSLSRTSNSHSNSDAGASSNPNSDSNPSPPPPL